MKTVETSTLQVANGILQDLRHSVVLGGKKSFIFVQSRAGPVGVVMQY